jgi:hypothetical protein
MTPFKEGKTELQIFATNFCKQVAEQGFEAKFLWTQRPSSETHQAGNSTGPKGA